MMVRGMSFQKGIFFVGKKNIACTYITNGKTVSWLKPLNLKTLIQSGVLVFVSMPLWFHLILAMLLTLVVLPTILSNWFNGVLFKGIPSFTIVLFFLGTHFWFPKELKKYHGAEHKVFSYKGIISIINRREIKKAKITNRHCSTNSILLYFWVLLVITMLLFSFTPLTFIASLEISTYISLVLLPLGTYWLNRTKETIFHRWILKGSYWLQKHWTTKEPDIKHINVAIRSYRRLALKEFPSRVQQITKRKERRKLAIADITVIPIGTNTTSVSHVVAEIHKILKETNKEITYELTPMSTLIEGELPILLEVIQELHEVPFKMGVNRVATNIRIDDRRDRPSTMAGKLKAVNKKLTNNDNRKQDNQEDVKSE